MEAIFFLFFACVLVGTYMSIRRQWAMPGTTAMAGIIGSIITMTLFLLSRDNTSVVQGIIFGVVAGALFGGVTLAVAWYFHSSELRAEYAGHAHSTMDDYAVAGHPQDMAQPEEYYE
jgi:uncharacterized membrane protein